MLIIVALIIVIMVGTILYIKYAPVYNVIVAIAALFVGFYAGWMCRKLYGRFRS